MSELEELKKAKLRNYTVNTFKKYCLKDNEWGSSKRRRIINQASITVYTLWHKKLLSRKFILTQGYENKERYSEVIEVQRILAGEKKKINRFIYYSMCHGIYVSYTKNEWYESSLQTLQLDGMRGSYYYEETNKYNDYQKYLDKSIHKYCAIEKLHIKYESELFYYLVDFNAHPELEMLLKLGLKHIYLYEKRLIRWKKKGINMLGINKNELKYLQSGMSLKSFRNIRDFVNKHNLSVEHAKTYLYFKENNIDLPLKQIEYASNVDMYLYKDYIDFINELGIPNSANIKYPKDLKKAHDELVKQIQTVKNEEQNKKIMDQFKKFEKLIYENEKFCIFPTMSIDELIEESKVLDHCVRTYAEQVANGETEIMFVREKDKKDKPLYTLELKQKRIIQFRAKNNTMPKEEAIDFVKEWSKKNKLQCNL